MKLLMKKSMIGLLLLSCLGGGIAMAGMSCKCLYYADGSGALEENGQIIATYVSMNSCFNAEIYLAQIGTCDWN